MVGYMQIVEQTDKEKLAMYMKCKKKELAEMLINCNKYLEMYIGKNDNFAYELKEKDDNKYLDG